MNHAEEFSRHRPLLFTVAYELLGSAADADDVLQESWLRWATVTDVRDPRAYLVRVVTRQSLNHLRAAQRRREDYVGPWLPEPIRTTPDLAGDLDLAESVSVAMMLVLETLSPLERAVFVLAEVFGYSHAEIAEMLDRTAVAVRQTAHRAREHVRARRRRFDPPACQRNEVVERFVAAAQGADLEGLLAVLSGDVVAMSDGGGKASAARRPVTGAANVAQFVAGLVRKHGDAMTFERTICNDMPGLVVRGSERIELVLLVETDAVQVTALYFVRNPDKLSGIDIERALAR